MENLSQILLITSYVCYALTALFALIALAIFVRRNLINVFRDLSGKTQETAIMQIRAGEVVKKRNKSNGVFNFGNTFDGNLPHKALTGDNSFTAGGLLEKIFKPINSSKNEETEVLKDPTGIEDTEQLISSEESKSDKRMDDTIQVGENTDYHSENEEQSQRSNIDETAPLLEDETQFQDGVSDETQLLDYASDKAQLKDCVSDETQTLDYASGKTQLKDCVSDETESLDYASDKTQLQYCNIDEILQMPLINKTHKKNAFCVIAKEVVVHTDETISF